MLEKRYPAAQARFEEALARFEGLAEAHNNLAFSLRMQGAHNFDRALKHYDRALELKPDLAQAYMYRGVLFTQTGDLKRASADHARLLKLDRNLAAKLEAVIVSRVVREATKGLPRSTSKRIGLPLRPAVRRIVPRAEQSQPCSRSNASSRRSAFPRWLTACFSSGESSAAVSPRSGRRKWGS